MAIAILGYLWFQFHHYTVIPEQFNQHWQKLAAGEEINYEVNDNNNTVELTVAESPSAATTSISPGLSLCTINTTYIQHIPYTQKLLIFSLFHQLSPFSLVELANFKSS